MFKVLKFDSNKVNFIDDRDNFVGFDTTDDCCAHGDWFILPTEQADVPDNYEKSQTLKDFPTYTFDEKFFKEVSHNECNMVIFKLISYDEKDLFLHLFNCHNGYYGKGFKSVLDDKVINGVL